MTVCDFSHLRSDVRELANTGRKKKTERQAMASFQEEKNIWEFLSLEESQLEGGKIKAYRYMNCMEKMKGEWPLLCWREDEIGRRKDLALNFHFSWESCQLCIFYLCPKSCILSKVKLAKNASSAKETARMQLYYRNMEENFLATTYQNENIIYQRRCF